MDFSNQFEKVKDTVVNVLVFMDSNQIISSGTGVLIGDGTKVLTCSHCINSSFNNTVRFSGSEEAAVGKIIYDNPSLDIAVLEFTQSLGKGVDIKSSTSIKIGNEAFVVGFPNNINKITALSANIAGFEMMPGFEAIRIDSSVNHGNSGGPLFNSNGELIGIVNAKHGGLSDFLEGVKNIGQGVMVIHTSSGMVDPMEVTKKLIEEMKTNLNLGIGYAIPTMIIGENYEPVKSLIQE